YQYSTGRAAISDELSASIWLKGSRPGAQLAARVVLPNERDPNNLDQRLSTVIRGDDAYRMVGKWQRLEIGRPVALLKRQQQLMQAQYKRPIDTSGAFIDTLVLNVYSGPGPTELWIDDLEIGPVQELPSQPVARSGGPTPGTPTAVSRPSRAQVVEFNGNQLLVGGKPYFFRGIRHTDTPLRVLRDAGFNTILFEDVDGGKVLREGVD